MGEAGMPADEFAVAGMGQPAAGSSTQAGTDRKR
jgi:hypothetical protein